MAQPEFTKKKMLLFMVATGDDSIQHQPVPNSSSFHENTSRIHLKIQKNQTKIKKRPFFRTKNEKCHPKGTPQKRGPPFFGSANTRRTLQAKRPRRGLVICCPFGLAMGHTGSSSCFPRCLLLNCLYFC